MSEHPIHPLQAMINGMSAAWQEERSHSQMTLGGMIAALEALSPDAEVFGLGGLMSYRGYYSDLAFEPIDGARPVADVLRDCRSAMGETFEGYKGGDYLMGKTTPLWVSAYGRASGDRLMGLGLEGNTARPLVAPEKS